MRPPEPASPLLLRARSGRTAALVLAVGFGGGTLLLGAATIAAGLGRGVPIVGTLLGHLVAASPFFLLAAVVAACRSELVFSPEERAFRLLTYRPWRLAGPRVEQAMVDEYAGVRIERAPAREGGGALLVLVTREGDGVPVRQFEADAPARELGERLASSAGLWLRDALADGAPPPAATEPPST